MGIMWNNTGVADMARELNEKSGSFKSAVDGMYNLFRQDISNDWKGKAYNVVVDYVNSLAKDWSTILQSLQASIPNGLTNQLPGKGYNDAVNYPEEIDISAWSIEPSTDDLNTFLNPEQIEAYFNGQGEKSINYYTDSMIQCLGEYVTIFDNHVSDYTEDGNTDTGVLTMRNGVDAKKTMLEGQINALMTGIITMANVKESEINEIDADTMKNAMEATNEGNIGGDNVATDGTDASSKIPRYINTNSAEYNKLRKEMYADLDEEYISQTEVDAAKKHLENLRDRKAPAEQIREAESKYNELSDRRLRQTITESDVQAARKQWENFEEQNTEAGKISAANKKAEDVAKQYEKDMTEAAAKRDQEVNAAYEKYSKAEKAAQEPVDEANQAVDDALKAYYEKYGNPDNQ